MSSFLFQPGSDLAAELGVTAQDDVLFAVFSTPDSAEGTETPNNILIRKQMNVEQQSCLSRSA
jgi:hypothetical protein